MLIYIDPKKNMLMQSKISCLMRKIHFYVDSVKIQQKCLGVLVLIASLAVRCSGYSILVQMFLSLCLGCRLHPSLLVGSIAQMNFNRVLLTKTDENDGGCIRDQEKQGCQHQEAGQPMSHTN